MCTHVYVVFTSRNTTNNTYIPPICGFLILSITTIGSWTILPQDTCLRAESAFDIVTIVSSRPTRFYGRSMSLSGLGMINSRF